MAAMAAAHSSFDHFDHREMAVASVYAEAIYRLAEEKGSEEALLQELESVAEYLDSDAGAAAFFSSPLVDAKTRARLLEKAFRGRASELLTDSLRIVQRKGRLELLPVIVAAYRACHDQRRDVVDARVTRDVRVGGRVAIPAGSVVHGTVTEVDYSPTGAEARHTERPFALTFALRQTLSGRWQVSAVTPTPPAEP